MTQLQPKSLIPVLQLRLQPNQVLDLVLQLQHHPCGHVAHGARGKIVVPGQAEAGTGGVIGGGRVWLMHRVVGGGRAWHMHRVVGGTVCGTGTG